MIGVELKRVKQTMEALDRMARDPRLRPVSVVVGFTQSYALYVHENLEAYHPVGQAKYLEQPFRTMQWEIARIITAMLRAKRSTAEAFVAAGLRLQRAAQKLCPVDTGALRASAFTRLVEKP